jgi:hypothetical protein
VFKLSNLLLSFPVKLSFVTTPSGVSIVSERGRKEEEKD